MEIMAEETKNGSTENDAQKCHGLTSCNKVSDGNGKRSDGCDTGSETIENINNVQSIHDGENPEYRQWNRNPARQVSQFDVYSRLHEYKGSKGLAEKFLRGSQDAEIIDQSHHQSNGSG